MNYNNELVDRVCRMILHLANVGRGGGAKKNFTRPLTVVEDLLPGRGPVQVVLLRWRGWETNVQFSCQISKLINPIVYDTNLLPK